MIDLLNLSRRSGTGGFLLFLNAKQASKRYLTAYGNNQPVGLSGLADGRFGAPIAFKYGVHTLS